MTTRLWRGWTRPGDADAYERFLLEDLLPTLRALDGFLGAQVLRRSDGDEVAFVVLTRFASEAAIAAFAGDDEPTLAVIEPEAARLLARYERHAEHFATAELALRDGERHVPT